MWRQGDIYLAAIAELPAEAVPRPHCVLAEGEVTGHSHRVEMPGTATLYALESNLYLHVTAPTAHIVHDEHSTLTLPRGIYRVWRQREYTPEAIRIVHD